MSRLPSPSIPGLDVRSYTLEQIVRFERLTLTLTSTVNFDPSTGTRTAAWPPAWRPSSAGTAGTPTADMNISAQFPADRTTLFDYDRAMPNSLPWDGREPITDAMVRYGMRDAFQVAIDDGDKNAAAKILCDVGADELTALQMIAILIPAEDKQPAG
jgi:hypothetical protein